MTALEVLRFPPHASVQDGGRTGYRRFGVSTAGAMDMRSLALANALVGNAPDCAAIELPLSGAAFRVVGGPILLAFCGSQAPLEVSGRVVPDLTACVAREGAEITVGRPRDGVYGYLAVAGGILTKMELESRSFHRRSGIGGPALSPGVRLPCNGCQTDAKPLRYTGSIKTSDDPIRLVPGPQSDSFTAESRARLLSEPYRISQQSDRMGICLDGADLQAIEGHDIVSEGVVAGSVQVPGNGNPIVLGRDCQTTGGYPKIATVISADLDRLAQLPVGRAVRFQAVSVEEATRAAKEAAEWRKSLGDHMRPYNGVLTDLHGKNLIGGVTRGDDS